LPFILCSIGANENAFLKLRVPPGLKRDAFMPLLQERIETATNALLTLKQPH